MKKTYYITSPLYYVNAAPHIGHCYTQVACDTISRFLRQNDCDVFFMTGTDEHGEKIEKASIESGLPKGCENKFVDAIIPRFKDLWKYLDINYNFFIRTSDKNHIDTVKHILDVLNKNGHIYKKIYKGWFCTPCEMFWQQSQAPEGICPDCKRNLEKLDEENYFFKLSSYQDKLIKCIESDELAVRPPMRKNEVLSFLKGNNLQDLCISRPKKRLKWGIELPFDKDYVTYVWVDALLNYISGIGYLGNKKQFKKLWPADLHLIGKDILRHHAIYWPILLIALGEKVPRKVFAHGWWVIDKEKMSKSKDNAVDPMRLLNEKGIKADALRYFLLSQVQFGRDGSFTENLCIEKYNSDLANDLGNLLNRTLTMVEKYFDGVVPKVLKDEGRGVRDGEDDQVKALLREEIKGLADELPKKIKHYIDIEKDGPDFQPALKAIWELINKANKYIEVSAPWKYAKDKNTSALAVIIDTLVQAQGIISVLLYPFMPHTAKDIWSQLGQENDILNIKYPKIKWGI